MKGNEGKRPTLEDVARLAGVGAMTVSRVISGHPYVRPATARKVQAAIRKLAYRPSQAARILGGQNSRSIGLIVPDLKDPFFAFITHEVQETAGAHNYLVWVVASNNDPETEERQINQMFGHHVDGIILIPADGKCPHLVAASKGSPPFVTLDQPIEVVDVDSVQTDNRLASERIVEHLVGHGLRKIVCLGYNGQLHSMRERLKGYKRVMKRFDLPARWNFGASDAEKTRALIDQIMHSREKADAFFTINNVTTLNVLEALYKLGIGVPNPVALAGFDDLNYANLLYCPPTVVRQPSSQLGTAAVLRLIERIESGNKLPVVHTVLPAEIVVRASCGCTPQTL